MIPDIDPSKMVDGFLFAIGAAALWFGTVLTLSIARSFGAAGGAGMMWAGKFLHGRHRFIRGDASEIVNVTLNTTKAGKLSIDTIVADQLLIDVWPNLYHVHRLKAAAKACTETDPVIKLTNAAEYRATYDPLVSLVAERCTNNNSIDLALGAPMIEHRFILALTYEKHCNIRSQHFRVMMVNEAELKSFPRILDSFARPEHTSRFETLQRIAASYRECPERFGVVMVWRPVPISTMASQAAAQYVVNRLSDAALRRVSEES